MRTTGRLNLVGAVCALTAILCPLAGAQYGGGSGTDDDPHLIYTPEQLNAIGADPNDWGSHFKLMADIDLAAYQGDAFHPIGSRWGPYGIHAFGGTFDGGGHTISNLTYASQETWPAGLFAYVAGPRAQIRSLTLVNPTIDTPNATRVGALIGSLGTGTVVDCHVAEGSISGTSYMGGLIGDSVGSISDCTCRAEVQGAPQTGGWIGGLVGHAERGAITNCRCDSIVTGEASLGGLVGRNKADIVSCRAAGAVSGERHVGGLVGSNFGGKITSCCSTANVTGTGAYVGGFVGYGSGKITSCFSSGAVEGDTYVGGFGGMLNATISHCYATGTVEAQALAGGFAGGNPGHILFSYSTGQVTGEKNLSGFAPPGATYLCYWDMEASGIAHSGSGRGRTTAEMMTASTFAGWGYESRWVLHAGSDYPRLVWEDTAGALLVDPPRLYGGGAGEPNDPYRISTPEQLATIGYYREDFDKHFLLTGDIDLSGIDANNYLPIEALTGTFDGGGHAILNFTYSAAGNDYVGLFVSVGRGGVIRDLHLIDAAVAGRTTVGALAARNEGEIRGCSITGTLEGQDDVGGLVGDNAGQIEACTVEGQVTGESSVGGLVGYNTGSIEACSAKGSIAGQTSVGGLVGTNHNEIVASCSAADVVGQTEVGGLVGTAGRAQFWMACPAPPPSFVPGLSDSRIIACYSTGQVTGVGRLGGLAGKNAGIIMGSYAACPTHLLPSEVEVDPPVGPTRGLQVQAVPATTDEADVGGLVGKNEYGLAHLSYWDTQVSGLSHSAGGMGRTTGEMATPETFKGWSFFEAWTLNAGGDYPRLMWMEPSGQPLTDDPLRYGTGSGTLAAPYQIRTPEHLLNMGYYPGDWDKHFVLTSDLDAGGVDPNAIWPIGTVTIPFSGTFDGGGHDITNLTLRRELELYVGLFGSIQDIQPQTPPDESFSQPRESRPVVSDGSDPPPVPVTPAGILSNLHLKNAYVCGLCQVGALAGHNEGNISACAVTGQITALEKNAGGLVGYNVGTLEGCSADVAVTAGLVAGSLAGYSCGPVTACAGAGTVAGTNERDSCAGGLIGENVDIVTSSHFCGDVVGGYTAGGLVALNEGTISRCSAAASVTGSYLLGGLVGYNEYGRIIRESFAASTTRGGNSVGGLVGCNNGTIENCYAVGQATGERRIGGLVGQSRREIVSCYSTCSVNGQDIVGGLVGELLYQWTTVTACFWDLETSGVQEGVGVADTDPNGVCGLPTASMQTSAPFVAAGWDFFDETENGVEDIWWIDEGQDYPRLWWEPRD